MSEDQKQTTTQGLSAPRAQDAVAEGTNLAMTAFVLPLLGGTVAILFYYFVFNPWLMEVLQ
jgi:hypothetical protein